MMNVKIVAGKLVNEKGQYALIIHPSWGGWRRDMNVRTHGQLALAILENRLGSALEIENSLVGDCRFPTDLRTIERLRIEWMTPGEQYRVDEYDGKESVERPSDICWDVA